MGWGIFDHCIDNKRISERLEQESHWDLLQTVRLSFVVLGGIAVIEWMFKHPDSFLIIPVVLMLITLSYVINYWVQPAKLFTKRLYRPRHHRVLKPAHRKQS